jgi:hypothetical protein
MRTEQSWVRAASSRRSAARWAVAVVVSLSMAVLGGGSALAAAGDPSLVVPINDSEAGGTYDVNFELVFSDTTVDGTPVYIYVPEGAVGDETVDWMDPSFDPNPNDDFTPCPSKFESGDYTVTQEQIDVLGNELVENDGIVEVDEAHFGPMGLADASDPASGSLVVLIYNVQDAFYYDCDVDTYTAGYFAPEYISSEGMNVIVIDSFDWANRIGDQTGNPEGQSELYEGVIAHELEHLLMNYSDPGELSWVDEGLADFAIFLNGFDVGGSHLTYHQVFHRETSLTRWSGGLENYGASFTFFMYLWEQAGGNGDGTFAPDLAYDDAGGDLLIKLIFQEQADGMEGVQNAIDTFNAQTGGDLRSAEDLFKDWALAIYLDDENTDVFDIKAVNFGDPTSTAWTIELANDVFFNNRGQYNGAFPEGKAQHSPHVPGQTALPFGTSYETFRKPGPTFDVTFSGEATTQIAPHTGDTHWYGGYESLNDSILDVDAPVGDLGGQTIDFWTWYFIEEGWDFGFVEALVNGQWVTVPLANDAGATVTTNENPHDTNEEGNGLTGTSGGAYFVDEPTYIHLSGELPVGTTDVRFRYSTDAAYLDTGWFVDDVSIGGSPVGLTSTDWIETTGIQQNHWVLQLFATCDLSPDVQSEGEQIVEGYYLYRLEGNELSLSGLTTQCLKATKGSMVAVISNLPTGDLQYLDADYEFRVTNTANGR